MYIHVRIKTKQKQDLIIKKKDLKYEVSVKEEPKQNMANHKLCSLLKDYFKAKNVRVISGHHSPSKLISIDLEE